MTQGFESVEHELEQKRKQLEQDLAGVRGRAAEIEAHLERVHEALGALTGHSTKKRSKGRSRSKKPTPSMTELHGHIAQVRNESPFADAATLERGVRALLQQSGSSLSGFKMLFAKALLTCPGSHSDAAPAGQHREHPLAAPQGSFDDDGPFSA